MRETLASRWVLGERMSMCDACLITLASWLPGDGVAIEGFAGVADHHRRMRATPTLQRVLALHG